MYNMTVNLQVPYKSQQDNVYNPSGSCNVTSMAMCLSYLGLKLEDVEGTEDQLEDRLYNYCYNHGLSRHDPYDLQKLVNAVGKPKNIIDDFTACGTLDDITIALDRGYPCVIHGYFTRFGHIIVIKGYDVVKKSGYRVFYVNDPWGEYYEDGYDTSVSGENLEYSFNLISAVCSPESASNPQHFWLHRLQISK